MWGGLRVGCEVALAGLAFGVPFEDVKLDGGKGGVSGLDDGEG